MRRETKTILLSVFFGLLVWVLDALVDYLPWRRAINSIAAVIIGTIIMGLSSFHLSSLTLEIIMNVVLVIIFFLLFEFLYDKKKTSKKNRF